MGNRIVDHEVLLLVAAGRISAANPSQPATSSGGDHWVRLASKVDEREVQQPTLHREGGNPVMRLEREDRIFFKVWSWGKEVLVSCLKADVPKVVYGWVVGKPPN
jgi:hypothetical protein